MGTITNGRGESVRRRECKEKKYKNIPTNILVKKS